MEWVIIPETQTSVAPIQSTDGEADHGPCQTTGNHRGRDSGVTSRGQLAILLKEQKRKGCWGEREAREAPPAWLSAPPTFILPQTQPT